MLQKIILIGNLGQDPEQRFTPAGTAVTNFSIATSAKVSKEKTPVCPEGWVESYNKKNWQVTTWYRITTWRGLAEMCNQYLKKGRMCYIEGEIKGEAVNGVCNPRIWTGNDGVPKASFEVTARMVKFLGGRSGEQSDSGGQEQEPPPGFVEESEIPF